MDLRQRFKRLSDQELSRISESTEHTDEARALAAELLRERALGEALYREPPEHLAPRRTSRAHPPTLILRAVVALFCVFAGGGLAWRYYQHLATDDPLPWFGHLLLLGGAALVLLLGAWNLLRRRALVHAGLVALAASTTGLAVTFHRAGRGLWSVGAVVLGALCAGAWLLAALRGARSR